MGAASPLVKTKHRSFMYGFTINFYEPGEIYVRLYIKFFPVTEETGTAGETGVMLSAVSCINLSHLLPSSSVKYYYQHSFSAHEILKKGGWRGFSALKKREG